MEGASGEGGAESPQNKKKRSAWLLAAFSVVSAALGFVANIGGARDFVCSLEVLGGLCPAKLVATAEIHNPRQDFFSKLAGTWGNRATGVSPACEISETYSIESGKERADILVIAGVDHRSRLRINTVEGHRMTAEIVEPAAEKGALVRFEVDGDNLRHQRDTMTEFGLREARVELVKCGDQ